LSPKNITQPENKDIIIQCGIKDVVGQVQWGKDGLMLGFEEDIPFYPHYSMIVDKARGVFNLKIVKLQGEDAGKYECQCSGKGSVPPIRASAYVNVLGMKFKF
jgi:hypothetical protein